AALLHKKLEKLDDALRGQPELPRRLQDLNAIILQRGRADQSISAYQVRGGKIAEPFDLSFVTLAGDPRSAEQILREHLEAKESLTTPSVTDQSMTLGAVIPSAGRNLSSFGIPPQAELSEHLWLLARW